MFHEEAIRNTVKKARVIAFNGHYDTSIVVPLNDYHHEFATLLRDPVARTISWFTYLTSNIEEGAKCIEAMQTGKLVAMSSRSFKPYFKFSSSFLKGWSYKETSKRLGTSDKIEKKRGSFLVQATETGQEKLLESCTRSSTMSILKRITKTAHPPLEDLMKNFIARTKENWDLIGTKGVGDKWFWGPTSLPVGTTFEEFVDKLKGLKLDNYATRALAGALPYSNWFKQDNKTLSEDLSDEELFKTASDMIQSMAFVGLTERYEDSMRLWLHKMGRKETNITKEDMQRNITPREKDKMQKEIEERIRQVDWMDIKLYELAKKRFEADFAKMSESL